jgi:hypothetical protein
MGLTVCSLVPRIPEADVSRLPQTGQYLQSPWLASEENDTFAAHQLFLQEPSSAPVGSIELG